MLSVTTTHLLPRIRGRNNLRFATCRQREESQPAGPSLPALSSPFPLQTPFIVRILRHHFWVRAAIRPYPGCARVGDAMAPTQRLYPRSSSSRALGKGNNAALFYKKSSLLLRIKAFCFCKLLGIQRGFFPPIQDRVEKVTYGT